MVHRVLLDHRDRVAEVVPALLERIQQNLYQRALDFRIAHTHDVTSFDQFRSVLEEQGGFLRGFFAGGKAEEKAIKEATGATVRCFPLDDDATGTCFYTGQPGAKRAIFAKAY